MLAGQMLQRARAVSIHAPVKGAISMVTQKRRNPVVSIHAPVKGAMAIVISHCN